MIQPDTQYTKLGDSMIAYQVFGEGETDLVLVNGVGSHVDVWWEYPPAVRFYERLATFARVIAFDRRGAGASDPVPLDSLPTWEDWTQDVHAVLDAASSDQAAIWARLDGGPMAMQFAATYPERTSALVLWNTTSRWKVAPDYPIGLPTEISDAFLQALESGWGTENLPMLADPTMSQNEEHRRWAAKASRLAMTPHAAGLQLASRLDIDARSILPLINVPTLVMHRTGCPMPSIEHGRYIADQIPGAKFVEIPGTDLTNIEHADGIADETQEFLTGVRPRSTPDRVLATVLFSDIVESTDRAASLGDRRWRELLDHHDQVARTWIDQLGGRLVRTTGDGVLATFDRPGNAIRSAFEMMDGVRSSGIELRVGIHTGEVELRPDGDIGGIAVNLGARVMGAADADEVACSRTVKDLVVGSEFHFEDRGAHTLKGVPDEWQIYRIHRP